MVAKTLGAHNDDGFRATWMASMTLDVAPMVTGPRTLTAAPSSTPLPASPHPQPVHWRVAGAAAYRSQGRLKRKPRHCGAAAAHDAQAVLHSHSEVKVYCRKERCIRFEAAPGTSTGYDRLLQQTSRICTVGFAANDVLERQQKAGEAPIVGCRRPHLTPDPPRVTRWRSDTLSPITAVSPTT